MLAHTPFRTAAALVGLTLALGCAPNGDDAPAPQPDPAPRPDPAPGPAPGSASIQSISPRTGSPGTRVTLQAAGFAPDSRVVIGFGPPRSEYDVVDTVRTGGSGQVTATVPVPSWAERGEAYLFVVADTDTEPKAVSDPFHVTTRGGSVRVLGEITDEGVECLAMRSPEGTLYTLAGGDQEGLESGDHVIIEGSLAEMSFCQQGTTLDVERIERR